MVMLETRLDNVIFRMGFARTRREARQIVDHKHVLVNGKCVNIPSYLVKAGDVIEVKEKCKGNARFKRCSRDHSRTFNLRPGLMLTMRIYVVLLKSYQYKR